jgi:hypothetical protein
MPSGDVAHPWTIRSTLITVSELERSVAFYKELGRFHELAREDAVAVLGGASSTSIVLMLREIRSTHQSRHGQQSLGLRSVTFTVDSLGELDRIEAVLKGHALLTSRHQIVSGISEVILGRDPDNLPLAFVCYIQGDGALESDYYQAVARLVYSLDV